MNNPFTDTSLLWPQGITQAGVKRGKPLPEYSYIDLGLDSIAKVMSVNERFTPTIKAILSHMETDPETIKYRQDILEDILNLSGLEQNITELFQKIGELEECNRIESKGGQVLKAVGRIKELDIYSGCLRSFKIFLDKYGSSFRSAGLCRIRELVLELVEKDSFEELEEAMPLLGQKPPGPVSITLGVNLDANLRPAEATILSINDKKFKGAAFFSRLFTDRDNEACFKGISELRSEYSKKGKLRFNEFVEAEKLGMPQIDSTPLQMILISDLHKIAASSIQPVISVVERYNSLRSDFMIRIKTEIAFYLGAVRLINLFRKFGLPMSRPELAKAEERIFNARGLYNMHLGLRMYKRQTAQCLAGQIVQNDLEMDDSGRFFILTGPNSGGKTTYIQGVALIQALFQAGLHVPASYAQISPVDNIFTHFPVEENNSMDTGRLGEESKRLNEIFSNASRYSMVMLNETFSSTSPGESLYMSRDIVYAMRHLGARGIFATHLHELGMDLENLNSTVSGDSLIESLVAGVASSEEKYSSEPARRTYKIIRGKPQGMSYARDIARHFGISFEQLEKVIDDNRALKLKNP